MPRTPRPTAARPANLRPPLMVLGATSLVGRCLMPRLTEEGIPAVAISRRSGPGDPYDFTDWIEADLTAPDLYERLPPADLVLSLSPIWLLPPALDALARRGMTRLVAFSSTSRFTKTASTDAGEREVAARLAESEAEVMAFCGARGIAWTILRPTLIYAEGQDGNVSRLAALIRRFGVLPLPSDANGLRQPVHADDLAVAALDAAVSEATEDKAYDLPGGETLTYRAMAERIFKALGKPVRILALPPWLWRLAFLLARPFLPGATAAMGERTAADLTFDAAAARKDFGWTPRSFRPRFKA